MTLLNVQIPVLYRRSSEVQEDDLPPPDDPFFYGWREVPQRTNGTEEWVRVPLTLEDVLHPQRGDVIVQGFTHSKLCKILWDGLEAYLAHEPDTVVLFDMQSTHAQKPTLASTPKNAPNGKPRLASTPRSAFVSWKLSFVKEMRDEE